MIFFGNSMSIILGNYLIIHHYGWFLYYDIALMIGSSSLLIAKQLKVYNICSLGNVILLHFVCKETRYL